MKISYKIATKHVSNMQGTEKKMIARHIWGCVLGNARYFAFKLGISKVSENQAAATTRAEFLNFTNTSTSTCEIF